MLVPKKGGDARSKLNRFLRYLQVEKGFSQGTIEAYRLDIERGLIPFLHQRGKFEVGEVTKDDIRAYLDYVATDRGNCGATRARKLAAIKSFFNYLVENEGLKVNPAASIRSPRIPEKEPEYPTDGESIHLWTTIARKGRLRVHERDTTIAVLFLHTGLRVSELTNLKLINVDFDRDQIKITRKGNKEQYLHLNGETVNMLARYLANRSEAQNGTFFTRNNGDNLDRRYIYGIVRRYLRLAGIDKGKHGPHILRHTFCTRLHQKGVDPFTIKDLAGHKSLNTTMRYIKIENKEQAEAIDQLEFGISQGGTNGHHLRLGTISEPRLCRKSATPFPWPTIQHSNCHVSCRMMSTTKCKLCATSLLAQARRLSRLEEGVRRIRYATP